MTKRERRNVKGEISDIVFAKLAIAEEIAECIGIAEDTLIRFSYLRICSLIFTIKNFTRMRT
jgi:hypothetical protein